MTDPAQTPVLPQDSAATAPAVPPADAPAGQSPLDVLDQILNDAQTKAATQQSAQEEEEKKKLEEAVEQQKQEDQAKLQEQIAELQTVKESPEYQAKVQQDQHAVVQAEEHAQEMEGMDIVQLGHTKV